MVETRAVRVKLATKLHVGDEHDQFSFEEPGQLAQLQNGRWYLRYTEHQNGVASPVQFRFDDEQIVLTRGKNPQTTLIFDAHQPATVQYPTAYGKLNLEVKTTTYAPLIDWTHAIGKVNLAYELHHQGHRLGKYQLTLQFQA